MIKCLQNHITYEYEPYGGPECILCGQCRDIDPWEQKYETEDDD